MSDRKPIRIDMTPMVDVIMLLLIFFMTTTSFKPPEDLAVQLPSSHSEIKVPESGLIMASIGADGTIFVGLNGRPGRQIMLDEFSQAIQESRMEMPTARVVVKADRLTPYTIMSDIMDALQATNVNTFSLVTEFESNGSSPLAGGGGR